MRWDLTHVRSGWTLKTQITQKKSENWTFKLFWCSLQSEVQKFIVVKSRLYKVIFKPHGVRLSHQSDYLLLDVLFCCKGTFISISRFWTSGDVCPRFQTQGVFLGLHVSLPVRDGFLTFIPGDLLVAASQLIPVHPSFCRFVEVTTAKSRSQIYSV